MNKQMKWLYRLSIFLLSILIVFIIFKLKNVWLPFAKVLWGALVPFLIGLFITYLLHPLVARLQKMGIPRVLAILGIYLLFFGSIGYGLYRGLPILITQMTELSENLPSFMTQYRQWVEVIQDHAKNMPEMVRLKIDEFILSLELSITEFIERALDKLVSGFNYTVIILTIPFISFYMLKDMDWLKRTAQKLTPNRFRSQSMSLAREIDISLGGYIRGQLLVCLLVGVFSAIFFWIIGLNYPLLLGTIIGLTNVIPYFGPIIGAIPAGIIALTMSMKTFIWVIVIIGVLQFVEGNIISPIIFGKSLKMHPLYIIFALLIGGELGGIIGLIIAVPILAILKVSIVHLRIYLKRMKEQKITNNDY